MIGSNALGRRATTRRFDVSVLMVLRVPADPEALKQAAQENRDALLGISERAKRLGTEAIFESTPGAGTTIRLRVAVDREFPVMREFQPNENKIA